VTETTRPFVSVIVPCRNELAFISRCLDSIAANDYPRQSLEILVVDGMSDDGTRSAIESCARSHSNVALVDNTARTTPAALNLGIRRAKGTIIMRMDAHCIYPPNYISRLVYWLERTSADNVGGLWITQPSSNSRVARAIAIALSHPFGVGNARYRVGVLTPQWVDTVPFGCYRREIFDRVGMFDEDMLRNQDDEFNHRLVRHGGRILLVPDVVAYYYARESLSKLGRMCFQYGYFKPLAARKVGRITTVRQLAPAVLVGAVGLTAALAPWWKGMGILCLALIGTYGVADVSAASTASFSRRARCFLQLCLAFPAMHVSYGLGYLRGVVDFVVLGRRPRRVAQTR